MDIDSQNKSHLLISKKFKICRRGTDFNVMGDCGRLHSGGSITRL